MSGEGYKATIEWGFWKFIKYLIVPSILSWFASWIATRYFSLDIFVWNWLVAVHLANLWLFIPEATCIAGAVLIFRWGRKTEKKNRYKNYLNHMSEVNKLASSEVKKDNK